MQLLATPTFPLDVEPGSMIDVPELADEYAVLVDAQPSRDKVAVVVSHSGVLHSLDLDPDRSINVISYADVQRVGHHESKEATSWDA